MAGGLMQLVAYGAQDVYLTGNPQITFFKVVYRRYTNFAMETIENYFVGNIKFGNKLTIKIPKTGDLINKLYIKIVVNSVEVPLYNRFAWVRKLGHAIIDTAEVEIGGTIIDRHYGVWMDIWYELSRNSNHDYGYSKLIGDVNIMTNYDNISKPEYTLLIPLQFWFNRYVGLSVPLIAMQYNDIIINIYISEKQKLIIKDTTYDDTNISIKEASILINYIYLDTDERRRFAYVGHEYLIEQVQCNGPVKVLQPTATYILNYNHPTKEIIWAYRNGNYISSKRFLYYNNNINWENYVETLKMTPLLDASIKLMYESFSIGVDPTSIVGGTWGVINGGSESNPSYGNVGKISVINYSSNKIYINNASVIINGTINLIDKITADIIVFNNNTTKINYISSEITTRDLSVPYNNITDTRYNQSDPIINQFSNYGVLIDGTINPIMSGLMQMNGHNRFDKESGTYFNYVQPYEYHSNVPRDGINVYSFSIYPEQHQPSGTANLSRIESVTLLLTIEDINNGNQIIDLVNEDNELWVFGTNYNILRFMSGIAGLAYSTI